MDSNECGIKRAGSSRKGGYRESEATPRIGSRWVKDWKSECAAELRILLEKSTLSAEIGQDEEVIGWHKEWKVYVSSAET